MTFDELPNLKIINDDCTLTITETGQIENLNGVVVNTPKISEYFLNKCSFKGVTVKYNHEATKKALNEVSQFFDNNLSSQ